MLMLHVWRWHYRWPGGCQQTTLLQQQRPPRPALCCIVDVCVSGWRAAAQWEAGRSSTPPRLLDSYQGREASAEQQPQPGGLKRITSVTHPSTWVQVCRVAVSARVGVQGKVSGLLGHCWHASDKLKISFKYGVKHTILKRNSDILRKDTKILRQNFSYTLHTCQLHTSAKTWSFFTSFLKASCASDKFKPEYFCEVWKCLSLLKTQTEKTVLRHSSALNVCHHITTHPTVVEIFQTDIALCRPVNGKCYNSPVMCLPLLKEAFIHKGCRGKGPVNFPVKMDIFLYIQEKTVLEALDVREFFNN